MIFYIPKFEDRRYFCFEELIIEAKIKIIAELSFPS